MLPVDKLAHQLKEFIKPYPQSWEDDEKWQKVVAISKDRLTRLSDIKEAAKLFYTCRWEGVSAGSSELDDLRYKGTQAWESARRHLLYLKNLFAGMNESAWTRRELETAVMPYADQNGRGDVLWPLRVALSGEKQSPGQFEIAEILGKSETMRRLDIVIANLPS